MLIRAVLLCLTFAIAYAALARMRIPPTPKELAHKQGCYIKEINDVIGYNESVSLMGICEGRYCQEDYIVVESCGVMRIQDGCFYTDRELSRPYSTCCPQMRCDLGENPIAE